MIGGYVAISQPAAVISKEERSLAPAIIADGQWIVADMDGTLIAPPGRNVQPTLEESDAKAAIMSWLAAGGHLIVITSCETNRSIDRFAKFIPEKYLNKGQLVFSSNGGAVLSYYKQGQWVSDQTYLSSAIEGGTVIPSKYLDTLLEKGAEFLNAFYNELRDDPQLLEKELAPEEAKRYSSLPAIAQNHPAPFTIQELVYDANEHTVPRIEVRRDSGTNEVTQICFMGVPADLKRDTSAIKIEGVENLEFMNVALTHALQIKGVDKALVVRYLTQFPQMDIRFDPTKSIGIGDRPSQNDAPLAEPGLLAGFVSVCERKEPAFHPPHIRLRYGENTKGTARFLNELLERAHELQQRNEYTPVITRFLQ